MPLFTETELICLRALLDTIIPADDYPGAWEAGVGDYLQRQLEGDLADSLPTYQAWLADLDAESRANHGAAFAAMSLPDRTQLLARVEKGELETDWTTEPGAFFREIVEHCAEGYYSDPGNGGNRGGIAWDMIGYEVTV